MIRPVLSIGVATLYGRVGFYFDDAPNDSFVELGLIGKWPKQLDDLR